MTKDKVLIKTANLLKDVQEQMAISLGKGEWFYATDVDELIGLIKTTHSPLQETIAIGMSVGLLNKIIIAASATPEREEQLTSWLAAEVVECMDALEKDITAKLNGGSK